MPITENDHATARFTEPMDTEAQKVSAANTYIAAIKLSPNWTAATDVQTAIGFWSTETANLDAGAKLIASLEKQLEAARTAQLATLRRWNQRRQGVLYAINVFCDGSKDKMLTFSVALATQGEHTEAGVPVGLIGRTVRKTGVASVEWFATPRNRTGFMVQHATDTTNAATYSAPIVCSKRSFDLTGQTPGAIISFRVLALDPSLPAGQTSWSAWVTAIAST
jgi:hypothetical protein